ncbi:MAG: hypothetical protein NC313_12950 [Butyrivibrio sp.]|nr:hypothetical protein [Butyrivibrio sp.]
MAILSYKLVYKSYFGERKINFVAKKVRKINVFLSIENWCEWLAKSDIFTALCSIVTLVGFLITIYISLKTKSINQRLEVYKRTKEFNTKRKKYILTLEGYQKSLTEDGIDIYKIKINILNDINIINESFRTIMKVNQRIVVCRLKKELEKSKSINTNRVCNLLSQIRAYMSNVKEEYYE